MPEMEHSENAAVNTEYYQLNQTVIRSVTQTSRNYWMLVGTLALMVAAGVFAFIHQIKNGLHVTGLNSPVFWGIYISTFVFWIGLSHAGTLLSAVLYLTKSQWRKPIYRSAEMMTFFALINAGLLPIIHLGRPWFFYWVFPPFPNDRQLWTNLRSPLSWDAIAINSYLMGSLLFLLLGLIPDIATMRDYSKGWRRDFYRVLALGWRGSSDQWLHFRKAYTMVACFIIPLMVLVSSIVGWDFAITQTHGLHSTIFAPLFVLGALYSGAAAVLTLAILMRKYLHLESLIKIEHLEKLALFLFGLCLLWIYLMLTETVVLMQSEDAVESALLALKMTGPFSGLYWTMVLVLGICPFALLLKRVRRSFRHLFIISILINVGMWIERYLILIPSLAVSDNPFSWGSYLPSLIEITINVGLLAFFALNCLLFIKLFPAVSMYEMKELSPLNKEQP